jgi:hypothetical protein
MLENMVLLQESKVEQFLLKNVVAIYGIIQKKMIKTNRLLQGGGLSH